MQPLALQPPLHVGERDHDGVDLPGVDPCRQLLHAQVAVVAHVSLSSLIPAARAAARPCRRSGAPSRAVPATASRARIASTIGRAGRRSARCSSSAPGSRVSISCRDACTEVTASTTRREPGDRGDGQVEAGVGLPVRRRRAARRRPPRGPAPGPGARRRTGRCRPRAAQAPGSTRRRNSSASSQSSRRDAVRRAEPRAGSGRLERDHGAAPASPRVSTSPASRRAAIASRRVARETSIRSASSRSGGSVLSRG